ncbi:MAG: NADH-quinone oxidoreductase subunit J [Chloroflexota bacterium]
MVEVYLFIVVGAVAIISATMMLLTENAVHSALFLILNFACVAFMYLMLEAPFLAMVQVAVYAGAIMVLFLFVIMLLGADQSESETSPMTEAPGSRYHTWVALSLALVTLLAVAVGIGLGDVDTLEQQSPPILRVVHAAGAAEFIDVYLDGELLAEAVSYRNNTGFAEVEAGTHSLEIIQPGEEETVLWSGEIEVESPETVGYINTAVVFGVDEVDVQSFTQDYSAPTAARSAKLTVFNAFNEPVSLQDIGVFGRLEDGVVLISALEPGEVSESVVVVEGEYDSMRLVRPADEENDSETVNAFFSIRDREFTRNSTTLFVVAEQPGTLLPNVTIAADQTMMPFGSPQAIGASLFTQYVLPLQVVGLLLLAALVGVVVVAQRQVGMATAGVRRRPVRRRVSRPLVSVIASQVQGDDQSDNPSLPSGSAGD